MLFLWLLTASSILSLIMWQNPKWWDIIALRLRHISFNTKGHLHSSHQDQNSNKQVKSSNKRTWCITKCHITGFILGLRPANERRSYFVTMSFIGWAQTWNQPCIRTLLKRSNLIASRNVIAWESTTAPEYADTHYSLQKYFKRLQRSVQILKHQEVISSCIRDRISESYLSFMMKKWIPPKPVHYT